MYVYVWQLTFENAIMQARYLTEEEKLGYNKAVAGSIMVACGPMIAVPYVDIIEVRKLVGHDMCDGELDGSYNQACIVADEQRDELLALNHERTRQARVEKLNNYIECNEKLLASIKKLYTKEQAESMTKAYNDKYNEGGYGYVPHYYTYEEYENIKKRIDDYKSEVKTLIG